VKIKYSDVVKMSRKSCKTCLTLIYTMPCEVDRALVGYMSPFGESKFDLKVVSLLHIESDDNYTIRSKIGRMAVSLSIPKRFEKFDLDLKTRKPEFEQCLVKWLENKLDISIVR